MRLKPRLSIKKVCSYNLIVKMVDEATKKTLAAIPLLSIRAGPRDGDKWVERLKEEYVSLIKVSLETQWNFKNISIMLFF